MIVSGVAEEVFEEGKGSVFESACHADIPKPFEFPDVDEGIKIVRNLPFFDIVEPMILEHFDDILLPLG